MSRISSFLAFGALAFGSLLVAGMPFPTSEQLRPLEEAAAKAHPIPEELRSRLLDKLAADTVEPVRPPLRRLWLPHNFSFDAAAFCQAFGEDWNNRKDADERMTELNGQFAPVLQNLLQMRSEREQSFLNELDRQPGVIVLDNGMRIEAVPAEKAEEKASVQQADSFEFRDLRGDLYYAAPIGEGDLIDLSDLPQCIAEITGSLPHARAWVIIVPTSLLDKDECRNVTMGAGHLVIILRHGENEETLPGRWGQLAAREDLDGDSKAPDNTLRIGLSQFLGHALALFVRYTPPPSFPELLPTDREQLQTSLLRHLNRATASREEPQDAGNNDAMQTFHAIQSARQAEIERAVLRLHAEQPGVHIEKSGIQYSVNQASKTEENKPFTCANRVAVARIGGKKLFEQSLSPADLPRLAEIADNIPAGISWTFYIPASQTGDYNLPDDMGAGVVLTFSIADDEEEAEPTEPGLIGSTPEEEPCPAPPVDGEEDQGE